MTIEQYIDSINQKYKDGNATEHTFRGSLEQLIETIVPDVRATNEPKRQSCGAPDYILTKKSIPVGFIEAKDIGDKDLDGAKKNGNKEQFDRYKASLNNLIFTDYINFHLYRDGQFVTKIAIAEIIYLNNGVSSIAPLPENFANFENLIKDFCVHIGQTIKSSKKLAEMMAGKARNLANIIGNALVSDEVNSENSSLKEQMLAFKQILIHDISPEGFADVYAQTIVYGMFAARLHDPTLPTFSRQEAAELIPKSNPFLRKLFQYIAGYDLDDRIKWVVDDLVQIFLACNVLEILKNYGKSTKMEDPIIHFYEDFLSAYDPKLRKARGVWYTPAPVVNFIVRAVDDILKSEFNLPQGLADTSKIRISKNASTEKIQNATTEKIQNATTPAPPKEGNRTEVKNSPPLEGCPKDGVVDFSNNDGVLVYKNINTTTEKIQNASTEKIQNASTEKIQNATTPAPPEEGNRTLGKNSPPLEGCPKDGVVELAIKRNTINYMSLPYNPKLKERAKELRKAGNLAEVLFWNQVKNKQLDGLDFDRQKIIGNYIVDFYNANYNIVIEIDGSSHNDKQEYDAERDSFMKGLGLTVIRFLDIDVKNNMNGVINSLLDRIEKLKVNSTTPAPPKEGNKTDSKNSLPLEGCPKDGVVEYPNIGKVVDYKNINTTTKKIQNATTHVLQNSTTPAPPKEGNRTSGEQEVHKVQILDPATGTGTFLAEVVKHIHKKFVGQQGIWSNYVETHLLPRLNGFELLMASYAMAHLKLDLLLSDTGYKPTTNQRFRVYLTNSLEESHPDTGTLFASWLSSEAIEANHIKRDTPVMVVLGNPPYAVSSTNKGEWIQSLIADYKKDLNEKKINLDDDYIKFIRYGQYYIEKNGSGILAYISNNSFIDGITHRKMREELMKTFDKIYIMDLHGNSKKKEVCPDGSPDQNVFDIMQGVSINIFVKKGKL